MEEKNMDRRVRKTKRQLRLALMDLMCEKSVTSISVRELAERADINRGTFYIHYKDVNDLLLQLEDEMANRLIQVCKRHAIQDTKLHASFPYLRDLYDFILENADLCKVLLGSNGDHAYTERICGILRDYFLYDFLSMFYPNDETRLNYFCSFIVAGNLNLALTWLQNGAKESPEEMANLAGAIIMSGVGVLE
ncbi:MAG: TetR/AcrR family transcriptional regulator [Clostridiales bacterium]|nr:TetR/AcrR family transcriptional regulator [Candidatus Cacconaster stercorequi]